METLSLSIRGMTCGHCVARVRTALAAVPGVQVEDVRVGSADVVTEGTPAGAVIAAVTAAGYEAAVADATPATPNPEPTP